MLNWRGSRAYRRVLTGLWWSGSRNSASENRESFLAVLTANPTAVRVNLRRIYLRQGSMGVPAWAARL